MESRPDCHRPRPPRVLPWLVAVAVLVAAAAGAADRVYPAPEEVEPLPAGSRVPSVRVETVRGEPADLADLVRQSGALLVFYRGGW